VEGGERGTESEGACAARLDSRTSGPLLKLPVTLPRLLCRSVS
jgi:hypothetical protein